MSITLILVVLTGLISFYANTNLEVKTKLAHTPYRVRTFSEYYRVFTSGFVHADFWHLFFNMIALYSFGENVERFFDANLGNNGKIYYVILYFSGIVLANLPDLLKQKNNAYYSSLGASGGVSSVVFASVLIMPLNKMMVFPIPIPIPAYLFSILYLAYSVYMEKRQGDNINHMAHFWGGVWGFLFTYLLFPGILTYFVEQISSSF